MQSHNGETRIYIVICQLPGRIWARPYTGPYKYQGQDQGPGTGADSARWPAARLSTNQVLSHRQKRTGHNTTWPLHCIQCDSLLTCWTRWHAGRSLACHDHAVCPVWPVQSSNSKGVRAHSPGEPGHRQRHVGMGLQRRTQEDQEQNINCLQRQLQAYKDSAPTAETYCLTSKLLSRNTSNNILDPHRLSSRTDPIWTWKSLPRVLL